MPAEPLTPAAGPARFVRRLPAPGIAPGNGLRSAFRRFLRWYDRYLQRHALADLDERLLRDVGLTRADARREGRRLF